MKQKWQDEEYREKTLSKQKESWNQERKENQSTTMKQKWQDEEYKQKVLKSMNDRLDEVLRTPEWKDKQEKKKKIKELMEEIKKIRKDIEGGV